MHCALFGLLKESLGFPSGAGKTNRAELLFAKVRLRVSSP